MSDNKPNDTKDEVKDEPKDEPEQTLDLDQAHEKAVHELEEADAPDEEEDEQENDGEEEKDDEPKDKEEDVSEEPPTDGLDEDEEDDEDEPAPAVDETKISVKDSDGKMQEFDSLEEIPDDFEPYSYKEFGLAVGKLTERGIERKQAEKQAVKYQERKEREERLSKMKQSWDEDLETLIKDGEIPKEDNKEIVDGVYRVMQEEINADRPVNSFRHAYEIYSYRESKKEAIKRQEKLNKEKKARGGKVQPGGSSISTPSNRGKVFEAPPSGVSLDAVHEKVLGSL